MFKKVLTLSMLVLSALFMNAQTPLPLNPNVKHGTLPNGLQYFILHNEEPKERVNFYIAQKVGSTLETPEQLGLAHFLEHMAFNGTKNYPGKNMLNYLQSKGIRFGADINAYTAFDETVYNINNVPSTDQALMDSVLLVLHDWSGSILLEEDEINAERGVIEEEWRSRNSAMQRMYEAMLPVVYQEYQYQQMPIGKMEIVRNFPPQAIRDYYKKWYRPDQQGIIIVGDMDAAAMEQKVKDLFSTIEMPANAAPRVYPTVSDNKEPIYFAFSDKELQFPRITVSFKSDKMPVEMRNTVEGYVTNYIVENLVSTMINNRLDEYSKKPECKYAFAGVNFGDFLVSKTKAAFDINIIAKDDIRGAYDDALAIVARALKTGFLPSELVRARDEMLSDYEKAYNERNTTKSENLARELCDYFTSNEPAPGIEMEYTIAKQVLMMLPVEAINDGLSEILTPENQVILVSWPDKGVAVAITKEMMVGDLNNAINKEYEPYVDEVITDPLISEMPAPGSVTSQTEGQFGTTVFTLSNGVKVVLKPTDFKADEILVTAFKEGGKNTYKAEDAANVLLAGDAFDTAKVGNFDQVTLQKYLAGKKVALGFEIARAATSVDGHSNVKDLPTLMELIYAHFTALSADDKAFEALMNQAKTILANADKNPQTIFSNHIAAATYNNNPLFANPTVKTLEAVDYARSLEIAKSAMKNAADYTFIFTGNVNAETLKPLLEKYIATLPSTGVKTAPVQVTSPDVATGIVDDVFKQPMQVAKTMVYNNITNNNVEFSIKNSNMISFMGDLLDNNFTNTLREEEGGTYSPYAYATYNPNFGTWTLIYVFETNKDVQEKLITRAGEELNKLLQNGADEAEFNKVKEAAIKQFEINERDNSFWLNNLTLLERGHDNLTNRKEILQSISLNDLNTFMKTLNNGKNRIQVVMEGVEEAK